jgi:hypothetical protein
MKKLILGMAIVASALAFGQKDKKDANALNAQLQEANKTAMDAYNAKIMQQQHLSLLKFMTY